MALPGSQIAVAVRPSRQHDCDGGEDAAAWRRPVARVGRDAVPCRRSCRSARARDRGNRARAAPQPRRRSRGGRRRSRRRRSAPRSRTVETAAGRRACRARSPSRCRAQAAFGRLRRRRGHRSRLVGEERRGGVEAECLRQRVADDVDRRRRRARAVCRNRRRARSRPYARGWNRRAGASRGTVARGTAPRRRGRAGRSRRAPTWAVDGPITGLRAWLERQATRSTVGNRAAESSAETGAGASEWASGSQLCTGAQPTLEASPASSSRYAVRVTPLALRGCRESRQASASRPPCGDSAARRTMPRSAKPRPREVRIRYFQPASSARRRPLKPTRSADAAVVASTSSQAPPRFPISGTASHDRPEGEEQPEVDARTTRRPGTSPESWSSSR